MASTFVGIDVGKKNLDIHIRPLGLAFQVPNTPDGHQKLAATLTSKECILIALESTGGLEAPAAAALASAGLPVVIINARQVRDFAKALGKLAKTDDIDAAVLAHFADAVRPPIRVLPSPELAEIRELLDRRDQLIQMRVAESHRLGSTPIKAIAKDMEAHIAFIAKRCKAVEKEIDRLIQANLHWKKQDELLQSIPGIGVQTSRMFIGQLPELGQVGRQQIAHLVGLAPVNNDSGQQRGKRHIVGGRAAVRKGLYMTAVAAVRHDPGFKAFYTRLRKAGKQAKVAFIAVARKLLCIANAVIRDRKPWARSATAAS